MLSSLPPCLGDHLAYLTIQTVRLVQHCPGTSRHEILIRIAIVIPMHISFQGQGVQVCVHQHLELVLVTCPSL